MKAVAFVGVAVLASVGVPSAFAEPRELGYFCVTEFAGGVAYSPNQKNGKVGRLALIGNS
jgi:hypothetical protein